MLISLNWLRNYVRCDAPAAEIAHRLTMAGLEVEAIETFSAGLDRVVVGRIEEVAPHPNADHLKICNVLGPGKVFRVVCGAPNVLEGQLVPLGLDGAHLADGNEIRSAKIHGVLSQGMLCSERELGLGEDHSGIKILPSHLEPGTPLAVALELADVILDIGITPNRGDCLSLLGVAREVAALFGLSLSPPSFKVQETGPPVQELAFVTIEDPDLCPRYSARVVRNITIKQSPLWLRQRLQAQGVRAINNIVDITNYVMLEMGQPLHAFDYHQLEGNCIVVRRAKPGETFITLDGKSHRLQQDMLLICDAKRGVALAGIMGGLNSEVTEQTNTVLLESAYFEPSSTRRTAKALALNTESAYRFERGVDPDGVITALDRAAQLMMELGDGELASGRLDEYPSPINRKTIGLRISKTNRFLGMNLSREEICRHLESIQLQVRSAGQDVLEVDPPSFRSDLSRDVDLMEEVARLAGYDQIPSTLPMAQVTSAKPTANQGFRQQTKQIMTGLGFCEIISYSFISLQAIELLQLEQPDTRRRLLSLRNPLSEDQAVMRSSLIPCMLETAARNQRQNNFNLRLFELGKVFFPKGDQELPEERLNICGLLAGLRKPAAWNEQPLPLDLYDIKGAVEVLLHQLGTPATRWSSTEPVPYLQHDSFVRICLDDSYLGELGKLHTDVAQAFDLTGPIYIFDIDFNLLLEKISAVKKFKPLPRFPAVNRDLAVVISNTIPAQDLLDFLEKNRPEYAETISLFDHYRSDQVGEGKKSLAFRITYRSSEYSLTDRQVNDIHDAFSHKVVSAFQADLR